MNLTLYKHGIKSVWKLLAALSAVITMYFTIIVAMFDPNIGSALNEFYKVMPELLAAFGMDDSGSTLIGFMVSYLYGFIMLIFPLLFSVFAANRLISKQIDSGPMAYLLAAPVTRTRIALTQLGVLLSGIFAMILYSFLVGIISSAALFPGELDMQKFTYINLGALALQLFIAGICYLASCIFNDSRLSMAIGGGIPALGFIIQMLGNVGEDFKDLKYASFFSLFDPKAIVAGESWALWTLVILFLGSAALFAAGVIIFKKKDVPV